MLSFETKSALRLLRLCNIRPNTGSGAQQLLGKRVFFFCASHMPAQIDDPNRKPETLLFYYALHNFQLSTFDPAGSVQV